MDYTTTFTGDFSKGTIYSHGEIQWFVHAWYYLS